MKKTFLCWILILSIIMGLVLPEQSLAAVTKKRDYMITSFINKDNLVQGKTIHYIVHVTTIDPSNPTETIKNANQAKVFVFFNQGATLIKKQLTNGQKGNFNGQVKIPYSGKWQVLLIATGKNGMPNVKTAGPETLQTTWDVVNPPAHHYFWWIFGVLLLTILIFNIMRWRRKKRGHS